ncbi:MAG TPA: glycoside hydrolase family 31 protein [Flavobacterium sp.]|uniref:glycoside hydrolase family 31 protein n=1 Tax=unclassified Flavobacterium TaxID=196869 RepID=UPI0025C394DB|nr:MULTISPECIES: TIM-barrel domain-containing protein [unclassified Flavobacterium]HRE77491.1 glycoside hydrolase family 31 protein [Flavobacterium sp.]
MKKLFLLLLLSTIGFAQNVNRKYISHQLNENVLEVKTSDGMYFLQLYNDKIVETSFVPNGEKFNPNSHAVVLKPDNNGFQFKQSTDYLEIKTNDLEIQIAKSPFKISYYKKGELLLSEKLGYFKRKHEPLEKVKGNIVYDSTEVIQFNINATEKLYGGGARVLGMNRRGNRLALYNRADYGYETRSELMNFTIPIVISSQKYMVHFDNAPIGYLDLDSKKENVLEYETISGRKTYQVIVGNTWEDLIYNYTELTGRQPLPPRWALGNFSSRFGYHSEAEARRTIQKFQDENIPVDAIILDLYWFGKELQGTMGNLEVYRDSFPTFEKMVDDFSKMGIKTIPITEPFILTTSKKWQEAVDKKILATDSIGNPFTYDFYFGNTGIIDIFKPTGKNWFWDIYKGLANKGVSGVWGDLGEPEVFPAAARTFGGTADEVHNIYGHNWAKLVFEGYQKDFPTQRPFILMRSGYSGSQRYGMIPWSGDVNRTWGGLSGQVEISLQMGMQGLAYMHSDLGGFAGANLDDELYVRWLQYGVFNPIFRPHAQSDVASEPIFRSDWAKNLAKQTIELRYQMLPYNYSLAYENSQTGKPLMRPLFFEEPENEALLTKSDGYLWGKDYLVYPIMEAKQKVKEVYFPKNGDWIDFYSNKKHVGGSTEKINVSENHIPTFVRSGVLIPMTKIVQTSNNYQNSNLDLHLYFDEKVTSSERQFYFDEGNNSSENNPELLTCETEISKEELLISMESNSLQSKGKNGKFHIYHLNKKPKSIIVNNKKMKFQYNKKSKKLEFDYLLSTNKMNIKIKLK